jgi:DNA-binding transcriptional regulator YiaG
MTAAALDIVRPAPTLADLAQTANSEAQLAFEAGTAMIQHAINAGEALLAAKQQVPRGQWEDWLTENFERSMSVARQSMRIARHKQIVIEGQATNFKGALRLLHGGRDSRIDPVQEAEVLRLRREGMTQAAIARELEIPKSRVQKWCNPSAEKRRLERARRRTIVGRRALNRQQRDADVKRVGGSTAEAYSLVRKALAVLDRAATEQEDREVRRHLADATNRLYNAEDAIVKAVRLYAA